MLQLKYNNTFIFIAPQTNTEIERASTVFLNEELMLERSVPIRVPYTDSNSRELGSVFFETAEKAKAKFDVEVWESGTYRYNATLVLESSSINSEVPGKSDASGYLMIGLSKFYSAIKNKKMKELDLGGVRSFDYTSWDPTDLSAGFFQHLHDTWAFNDDYVVAPVRNENWLDWVEYGGWMNQMDNNGYLKTDAIITVFPKVKYLLEQMFIENGWTLDLSEMTGTILDKLVTLSVKPIRISSGGTPQPNIQINLAEHVSPEVLQTSFLLSRCKRYGWAPIFDPHRNSCKLVPVNTLGSGTIKDFTQYAAPTMQDDYSKDDRVFAFKNNIPSTDEFPTEPGLNNVTLANPVFSVGQLPDPSSGAYDEKKIYVFAENQYYKVEINSTTLLREWVFDGDSIFNLEPDGATDTYETDCSTLPVYWSELRDNAGTKFYGIIPACSQRHDKTWGMRDLIYHGLVTEMENETTAGLYDYPYVSSINVAPDGNILTDYSNVYEHIWQDFDYGIANTMFGSFNEAVKSGRIIERNLNLPLHELMNLKWNEVINIKNVPYIIRRLIEPLPWRNKKYVKAYLQKFVVKSTVPISNGGGTTYYLHIEWFSSSAFAIFGDYETGIKGSVRVKAFSDAAMTTPITPTGLIVKYRVQKFIDSVAQIPSYQQFTMNNQTEVIYTDVVREGVFTIDGKFHEFVYALMPYVGYVIV